MTDMTLLGLRISVYTRIARLALEEKGIDYELLEVDIFADAGPPADYLALNPFGTIPTLRHADLVLYETAAINRYIDEINPGASLQPQAPVERARMNQVIGMLDSYCYRPMIWDVYVQRVVVETAGEKPDEASIAAALPGLRRLLDQLESWCGTRHFLVGQTLSLADLHFYPMLEYFIETPEGADMMNGLPGLRRWLRSMQMRASVRATSYHDNSDAGG